MSDTMILYCWVLGDDIRHCFSVEIPSTKDVSVLKDAIKMKAVNRFQGIDAYQCTIWKVSIPFGERQAWLLAFQPREDLGSGIIELLSLDYLVEVFPDGPPPRHIHIVVQPPGKLFQF
jgi:Crinkler effector protein N-terminal domain